MKNSYAFTLDRSKTGLLLIDVQEGLFPHVERSLEVVEAIDKIIQGFQALGLPIIVSEQYPQGLGQTVYCIRASLGEAYTPWTKTTFSCFDDPLLKKYILESPCQQWVLVGFEAHVCILQTAKGLLSAGKDVVVLNDAIGSQSIYDFSTAIAEMRDCGVRISSVETVLFELLRDSQAPEFKAVSKIIKQRCSCCDTHHE